MSENIGFSFGIPSKDLLSDWGGLAKERTNSLLSKPDFFANDPRYKKMRTNYSSIENGNINIDPSIRLIQDKSMRRNANLYNELGASGKNILGNMRNLRKDYMGNRSAFVKARVDPLEEELTMRKGELDRNLGLRGMSGSSFGEQARTNLATDSQRELGNARSLAEMENLQAVTGIDKNITDTLFKKIETQMAVNNIDLDTANKRLIGELQALGVDQKQIDTMVNAFNNQQDRAFQERKAIADSILGAFKMGK